VKQLTWQLVTVIVVGIIGMVAMVAFLSAAGWSEGGIAGMVTGIGAVVTGIIGQLQGQQVTNDRIADLDRKTDTVVAQTNGLSDIERQDIARRAAQAAIREVQR
jgi:hypothetical protein